MSSRKSPFSNVLKRLSKLQKASEAGIEVSWPESFNDSFMRANTSFNSFNDMLSQSPFGLTVPVTVEQFKSIPDESWDNYVREKTKFSSWEEMYKSALRSIVIKKLE